MAVGTGQNDWALHYLALNATETISLLKLREQEVALRTPTRGSKFGGSVGNLDEKFTRNLAPKTRRLSTSNLEVLS